MWVTPSSGGPEEGTRRKEGLLPFCFFEFHSHCEFIAAVAAEDDVSFTAVGNSFFRPSP